MALSEMMLKDIARADPVERKAISKVMRLSRGGITDILWTDDSKTPEARRKRDFRIVMDGLIIPCEVKADFGSSGSGNIDIEYECNGNQSGLASTGSKVWIQMVPVYSDWEMYFAKVADLREHLMVVNSFGRMVPSEEKGVVGMLPWTKYRRTTPNVRCAGDNGSENMLLHIETHVKSKDWWYKEKELRDGSIDWMIFGQ